MTKKGGWPDTGFGAKLRALREGKGLSIRELAPLAGVHWNTLAKLERGEQEPAWPLVLALASALGVNCLAFNADAGSSKPPDLAATPPAADTTAPSGAAKSRRRKGGSV
jgi:transcriptional regulator with XRE-family HTH domain